MWLSCGELLPRDALGAESLGSREVHGWYTHRDSLNTEKTAVFRWKCKLLDTEKIPWGACLAPMHICRCLFLLLLQTGWWSRKSSGLSLCPYILSPSNFSSCTTEWHRNLRIKTLSAENLYSRAFYTHFYPVYPAPGVSIDAVGVLMLLFFVVCKNLASVQVNMCIYIK